MKILVIDVGGTNIKVGAVGRETVKIPSGPKMTPLRMVREVLRATKGWNYDRVSIGYPGPVAGGRPVHEPTNLAPGWVGFDFKKAFGRPVRLLNDAAMQALGGYRGGRMLFLGLGTGLGSAMIVDGALEALELGVTAYKKGKSYEDYLGRRGLERLGKKRWRREVAKVARYFEDAVAAGDVLLGGGNARKLKKLPARMRVGSNHDAFVGGLRLWDRGRSS